MLHVAARVRIVRHLVRRGVLGDDADPGVEGDLAEREPAMAQLAAAAVSGLPPAGPQLRRRLQPVLLRGLGNEATTSARERGSASAQRRSGRSPARARRRCRTQYGYVRDADACVVDKTWVAYYPKAFLTSEGTMHELDRLWQGAASGARPRCKSPFGVYDRIGNVDEWTRSSSRGARPC